MPMKSGGMGGKGYGTNMGPNTTLKVKTGQTSSAPKTSSMTAPNPYPHGMGGY